MALPITPAQLDELFRGTTPFALVDVREPGEYNASHIPGSSLIPRRMLEFDLPVAVPHPDSLTVLCDGRLPARRQGRANCGSYGLFQRGLAGRRGESLDEPGL